MQVPSLSSGCEIAQFFVRYMAKAALECMPPPPQTKIWNGRTNLSECVFEALFKGVSTVFGLRIVEKVFEDVY
jgi:hypothetical protein